VGWIRYAFSRPTIHLWWTGVAFSRPHRFGRWIEYLKKQHPGRLEETTLLFLSDIYWEGKNGIREWKERWRQEESGVALSNGKYIAAKKSAPGPLDGILEFTKLRAFHAGTFPLNPTVINNLPDKIKEIITKFIRLHESKFRGPSPYIYSWRHDGNTYS
jgi:hypothetical protein